MIANPSATTAVEARRLLRRHMHMITLAGCLAMVFIPCTMSPLATDFVRGLGATDLHFGLLGGIPMIMVACQFAGAFLAGRLTRRKSWFIIMLIGGRLLYLPAVLLPGLCPGVSRDVWVPVFIGCVALHMAMMHFATPLWFSWMGDLIPTRVLNRYWAERHRYLQLTWAASFMVVAAVTYLGDGISSGILFPIIATVGVVAGVVDIVLFRWIDEPPNVRTGARHPFELFMEPLRHHNYRSFVLFTCAFSAATLFAAAFMQIYVLKVMLVPRWQANLMWCGVGLGSYFVARFWGRLADRHGHRPILLICVALKPVIVIVFLLVSQPWGPFILTVAFFLDSMVNAGYFIASNGYTLKMAPRENRAMFVAATLALSGIAGGLAAIAGGWLLRHTEHVSWQLGTHKWINYHLVFALSLIARLGCIPVAAAIREPTSSDTVTVLAHVRGIWPLRMLMFPTGLARNSMEQQKRGRVKSRIVRLRQMRPVSQLDGQ